jgi:hypothetical protein
MKTPLRTLKIRIILGILALALLIFYFSFYKEYSLYSSAINSDDLYTISSYKESYPDGKYISEVNEHLEARAFALMIKDSSETSIENYKLFCSGGKHFENADAIDFMISNNVDKVRAFIKKYPKSKYIKDANLKIKELWENEIGFFDANIKLKKLNPEAKSVKFFRNLLLHMKEKNLTSFVIKFNYSNELKEFKDYSARVQSDVSILYGGGYDKGVFIPHADANNIEPFEGNFTDENIEELEKNVAENLKSDIESVFGEKFFEFQIVESDESANVDKNAIFSEAMLINIDYKIKNAEEMKIPLLLHHTRGTTSNILDRKFVSYIMDISTFFKLKMVNPEDGSEFIIDNKGQTAQEYESINTVSDAYYRMLGDTFNDFITKASEKLGLKDDK